jgi:hypothetical protein
MVGGGEESRKIKNGWRRGREHEVGSHHQGQGWEGQQERSIPLATASQMYAKHWFAVSQKGHTSTKH